MDLHSQNFLITNLARITKYSAVENGPGDGYIKLGTDFRGELHILSTHFIKSGLILYCRRSSITPPRIGKYLKVARF